MDWGPTDIPSAKNTDDAANLVIAPNDRVYFPLLGECGEVDSIFAERIEALLSSTTLDSSVAADLFDGRDKRGFCKACLLEYRPLMELSKAQ
jgi:hypothetical protein